MARYRKARRYFKSGVRPSYTVQRRVLSLSGWAQNPNDEESFAASVTLVMNPSDAGNDVSGGGNKTVKHIEVQLLQRPTLTVETVGFISRTYVGCIWMVVYVPEGTKPNVPFLSGGTNQMALYEPAQYVLGSGVIPFAGNRVELPPETTDAAHIEQDLTQYVVAGNATRIRVPLSKKLNPGDRIELIVATLNSAIPEHLPLNKTSMGVCRLLVKYALKYN